MLRVQMHLKKEKTNKHQLNAYWKTTSKCIRVRSRDITSNWSWIDRQAQKGELITDKEEQGKYDKKWPIKSWHVALSSKNIRKKN